MGFKTPHWNWVRLPSVQAQVYTFFLPISEPSRNTFVKRNAGSYSLWRLCSKRNYTNSSILPANSASIGLMGLGDAKTKKCGVLLRQRIHFRHHANWQHYCNDDTFPSQLICDFSLTPSSLGVSCRFPKKVCRRFSLSIYVIKSLRIVQRFTH